jgi:hypothetical protein
MNLPAAVCIELKIEGTTTVPLAPGGGVYSGKLVVPPGGGLLSLSLHSPRPLRVWLGRHLVFEDGPQRSSTYVARRLCAAACLPLPEGENAVRIEVEPRPHHIGFVDEHCESPRRAGIVAALEKRIPDELTFTTHFQPGATGPAACVRFERGQFRLHDQVWQEVWLRALPGFAPIFQPFVGWGTKPPSWLPTLRTEHGGQHLGAIPLDGRPPGEHRLYVPVTAVGALPPVARAPGHDDRPESDRAVVAKVTLTVANPAGEATLPMPVFELSGRLAPKPTYAEVPAPDFATVWAQVPEPILPAEFAAFGRLYRAAWELLCRLWRPMPLESGLPNGYVRTAEGGFHTSQFVWDTAFTTLAAAYGWRAYPVFASLDCLYSRQEDGGHIEREHDIRDNLPAIFEPGFGVNPPLIAPVEVALARLTGQRDRLRAVYPALVAHYRWIEANRRLPDGTYWTTGLANGLDNSPSQGEGYPDLTAQMAQFAAALADIADLLDNPADASVWRTAHTEIAHALNTHLWSESLGCYSTSLAGGGHNPNKVITTFWPLWAGAVPSKRITALAQLARDPATFNRHHPLPSLSADAPLFNPEGEYWRGSVWVPTNFAALKGFWRAGETTLAREFTTRHLQCMLETFDTTDGVLWENFCSEKSVRGNWSGKGYSWTTASPIALLLEIIIGLEPDAFANRLRWIIPATSGFGVRRYPLGPATVDLRHTHDPVSGQHRLQVSTDQPFTLEVVTPAAPLTFHLNPGTHDFSLSA